MATENQHNDVKTKTKHFEDDSNLILLNSNGFKYIKDIDDNKENKNLSISVQQDVEFKKSEPQQIVVKNTPRTIQQPEEILSARKNNDDEDKVKMQEIFGTLKINNDITFGLGPLEFEAAIEENEIIKYKTMRIRCHASYIYASAHAAYFISIANKFKRNAEDIRKNEIKIRNTRLLNENQNIPGLQIGIIGAGRLGRQLAHTLLEFGDVNPSELRVSTRQPEILSDLIEKNVDCFFDNRKLATTVNILFLCVLPHQLQSVLDEIKQILPKKCIIYSFVRTIPASRLKNLIRPDDEIHIFKPNYTYNPKQSESFLKWNYSLDIIESLYKFDMMSLTNPVLNKNDTILQIDDFFLPSMICTLLNICIFLKFNKSQCINAIKIYVFVSEKQIKFDEGLFIEPNNDEFLKPFNLIQTSNEPSRFSQRLNKSKGLQTILSRNYIEHFDSVRRWKNAYKS